MLYDLFGLPPLNLRLKPQCLYGKIRAAPKNARRRAGDMRIKGAVGDRIVFVFFQHSWNLYQNHGTLTSHALKKKIKRNSSFSRAKFKKGLKKRKKLL